MVSPQQLTLEACASVKNFTSRTLSPGVLQAVAVVDDDIVFLLRCGRNIEIEFPVLIRGP